MPDDVTLYRAVCLAEYQDLRRTRRFGTVPGSLEGKWFATTHDDAVAWGKLFARISGEFRIIRAIFPRTLAERFQYRPRLDGIGPAYFADMDQLRDFVMDMEESKT